MNCSATRFRTIWVIGILFLLFQRGALAYGGFNSAGGENLGNRDEPKIVETGFSRDLDLISRCRQHIARIVCLVDPVKNVFSHTNNSSRPCLESGDQYSREFQSIYDLFPRVLQQTMCSLDRIFVEKSFWASGYAHPRGRAIGIVQKILEERTSLSEWSTWKERLPFELASVPLQRPKNLPSVIADAPGAAGRAVYFIVAHELAHLIDLANNLSNIDAADYSRFSWRVKGRYITRDGLPNGWAWPCYYLCRRPKIDSVKIGGIYRDLNSSPFASLYATRNPSEDFAETLTYYVMSQRLDLAFRLKLGNKTIRDTNEPVSDKGLQEKLTYMKLLLERPYLIHGFPVPRQTLD